MDEFGKLVGGMSLIGFLIFVGSILGSVLGALSGEITSWVFGETIKHVLERGGITGVEVWQLGALMGFLGGFLKTQATVKSAD